MLVNLKTLIIKIVNASYSIKKKQRFVKFEKISSKLVAFIRSKELTNEHKVIIPNPKLKDNILLTYST